MPKKSMTNEDLAGMVQRGFLEIGNRFDKRFDKVEKDSKEIKGSVKILENGHEDIKLRLDNIAYRFELI